MIEHNITVKHLKQLLKKVKDTDLLVLNSVGNLLIVRDEHMIGYIDLHVQRIDFNIGEEMQDIKRLFTI